MNLNKTFRMRVIQKLFHFLSCLVVSSGTATEAAGTGGEEDRGWNRVEEVQGDQLNMANSHVTL